MSECTKVGGFFIGTCYDGNLIFNSLKNKKQNESIILKNGDHKLWEIRKEYDHDEFNNDATSLGYSIDVYQETINQYIREYLVNFDYLIRCMENFGFILVDDSEAKKMGLPRAMGNFALLYNQMEQKIKQNRRILNDIGRANNINESERKISFYNNYFVFKK